MKRLFLYSLIMAMLPVSSFAQDDMYFVPKKSDKKVTTVTPPRGTTPARPLEMSVDEYNRRTLKSSVEVIGTDSIGNDIIDFSQGDGSYPATDTIYVRVYDDDLDYRYSARMGLFDDFYGWYNPWYYDWMGYHYGHYWGSYWGPYWYSSYYPWYTPWYYGFYDPYYYYWGWDPYYSWYGYRGMGWTIPYWGYGGPYYSHYGGYAHSGVTGTHNHGNVVGSRNGLSRTAHHGSYTTASRGTFGGRGVSRGSSTASASSASGGRSAVSRGGVTRTTSSRGVFAGSRSSSMPSSTSSSRSSAPSYSPPSSSSSSYSGGSFGGGSSRSSGGSFGGGGSRSGGSSSGGGGGRLGGRR